MIVDNIPGRSQLFIRLLNILFYKRVRFIKRFLQMIKTVFFPFLKGILMRFKETPRIVFYVVGG